MLFTPKKRGPEWHWFTMVLLYGFSLLSCAAVIGVMLFSDLVFLERVGTALILGLTGLIAWVIARGCSKKLAHLNADDRKR